MGARKERLRQADRDPTLPPKRHLCSRAIAAPYARRHLPEATTEASLRLDSFSDGFTRTHAPDGSGTKRCGSGSGGASPASRTTTNLPALHNTKAAAPSSF